MEIFLQGRYTKQQIRRAFALDQGRAPRIANVAYIVVVVLFLAADVVAAVVGSVDVGTLLWESLPALLMLVLLGGALLGVPRLQAYLVQRTPRYQNPVAGVASDEVLVLGGGGAEPHIRWDSCTGYKMSEDLVLVYAGSGALNTVPREFFADEEDWQRFREHVQGVMPRRTTTLASVLRWLLFVLFVAAMAGCAILSILLEVLPGSGP